MTTAIIIVMLVIAVMLIAVLCGYTFYLKNEINHWYHMYALEEERCKQWQDRCESLVDIQNKSLDKHEEEYLKAIKKIDELVEDNLKKEEAMEEFKAKLEAFTDSMNDSKVINLPIFSNDIEELNFPNSDDKED